jgi:hypothetical protein
MSMHQVKNFFYRFGHDINHPVEGWLAVEIASIFPKLQGNFSATDGRETDSKSSHVKRLTSLSA